MNIFTAGVTPQGTKAKKVIAEKGQKVVGTKRSNSRENVTVVATINAAGEVTPPLLIFKGQRMQAAWVHRGGPPGALYTATESSFMQGPVFVSYIKSFHKHIVDTGKNDGKPHVLVLDGHVSHLTFEVVKLAVSLNIELFQLPSHSSHITQPLDVAAFGIFKKEITSVLQSFPRRNGGKMPAKSDMVEVIRDAFQSSFTPSQIKASFEGAGLWPVDMHRALNRLRGRGSKRPALQGDRPPLADVPVAISENVLAASLGDRAVRKLRAQGHTITGLRVSTVMFGGYLKHRETSRRPSISRRASGITKGGLLTCEEVMTRYEEDERQKQEEEQAKADRAAARVAKRAAREAAVAGTGRGQGRGRGRGNAPVGGRGGGRGVLTRGGGRGAYNASVGGSDAGVDGRVNQRVREAGPPSPPSKRTRGATAAASST